MTRRKRRTTQEPRSAHVQPVEAAATARRDRWPLAIFVIAIALRMAYFAARAVSPIDGFLVGDEQYYLDWAHRVAEGHWLGNGVFEQGPLYPYLAGLLFAVVGDRIDLLLVAQLVVGSATCVMVYLAGKRLFDQTTAAMAGLLAAVYGPSIFYEAMVMKTFLAPALVAAAIYALARYADEPRRRWLFAGGATIGAACLVTENHILLLAPAWLWLWLGEPAGRASRSNRLANIACLTAGFVAAIMPATLHNVLAAREWVAVTAGGGEVFYIGHGPDATGQYTIPSFAHADPAVQHDDFRREAERRLGRELQRGEASRYWFHEGLSQIAADSAREARLLGVKLALLFGDEEVADGQDYEVNCSFISLLRWLPTFGWIGGLGAVGLVLCVPHWRRLLFPLGVVAVVAASCVAIFVLGRFRMSMMPAWFLLAAHAARTIELAIRQGRIVRAIMPAAVAACISAAMLAPNWYRADDASKARMIGFLAARAGDLDRAERELRRAIEHHGARLSVDRDSATDQTNLAAVRSQLALILDMSGRHAEAAREHQAAVALPAEAETREAVLQNWAMFLAGAVERPELAAAIADSQSQLARTLDALVALRPDKVAYRAMRVVFAPDMATAVQAAAQLDETWRQRADDDKVLSGDQDAAWYHAARATLAAREGKTVEARDSAAKALAAWPAHPLRARLEAMRGDFGF